MASIVWSVGATEDFRQLITFIGRDSEIYAATMASRLVAAIDRLESHPRIGRVVPEYQDESIREIIVGNYRFVYRHRGQIVGLIAIVHGGRDVSRGVGEETWDFA